MFYVLVGFMLLYGVYGLCNGVYSMCWDDDGRMGFVYYLDGWVKNLFSWLFNMF